MNLLQVGERQRNGSLRNLHGRSHVIFKRMSRKNSFAPALFRKMHEKDITNKLRDNFENYIVDIEKVTGKKIPHVQVKLLREYIFSNTFKFLNEISIKTERAEFNKKRQQVREEWKKQTGNEWPVYEENVYSSSGKLLRKKGQSYDAHHIVELCFGGSHEWWNMHPASMPDQHQFGIHRESGVASYIFGPLTDSIKDKCK